MTYNELKTRQEEQLNNFKHIFFAFNTKQFNEGMEKIGLKPEDTKKIYSIGSGGYILKSKSKEFNKMFIDSSNELDKAMKDKAFLIDAINYELGNHEWCITGDVQEGLNPLGLELNKLSDMQNECLTEALKLQRAYAMEYVW